MVYYRRRLGGGRACTPRCLLKFLSLEDLRCIALLFSFLAEMAGIPSPIARRFLHSLTGASPDTRRTLPVAPLIGDKRCYGECPASVRRGPRDTPVQVQKKGGPEAKPFWGANVGFQECQEAGKQ